MGGECVTDGLEWRSAEHGQIGKKNCNETFKNDSPTLCLSDVGFWGSGAPWCSLLSRWKPNGTCDDVLKTACRQRDMCRSEHDECGMGQEYCNANSIWNITIETSGCTGNATVDGILRKDDILPEYWKGTPWEDFCSAVKQMTYFDPEKAKGSAPYLAAFVEAYGTKYADLFGLL